ncbi:MAG: hypothetical protein JSU82_02870 [Rhodospirillales bacterium]|nr:MAG: hypothetical protein JSU82_02870 [Rhodospirillales bacterium]
MADDRNSAAMASPRTRRPSLAEKIAFLGSAAAHLGEAGPIEVVETHMSFVFLSERFAHKLKKPVRYEFLNFRSLAARRRSCREEVRLNRRLAPQVYIGAIPLAVDAAGALRLGGAGAAVDWLVKMHRLPADRMLEAAIRQGTVKPAELEAVARLLADFYAAAAPVALAPAVFRRRIAAAVARDRRDLEAAEFDLPAPVIAAVCAALDRMLTADAALFDRRVRAGCIVEGHGDLRPEHVYLGPEPAVIDCLEFNRDFRILDRAEELAYLAMECERLGAAATGTDILDACCRALGDSPPPRLLVFYKACRALLRARLAILHLRDDDVAEPDKWRHRALDYLGLAEGYARRLR